MRSIVESLVDDIILTKEEELINDTKHQKQKGELLNFEDAFGE